MNNIGIIIQCRDFASRYPNKCVKNFFHGKTILDIIIDKFKHLGFKIIVNTTEDSYETIRITKEKKVNLFLRTYAFDDVLFWFTECAKLYELDGVFRVCADNPLIQLSLMYPIKAHAITEKYDYISFERAMQRHEGFFLEYISTNALEKANKKATIDREHVTKYIYEHPSDFNLKILPIPPELNKVDLRLTVDTKADFKIARLVYSFVGENHWLYVANWCYNQPEILKKMKENIKRNPK